MSDAELNLGTRALVKGILEPASFALIYGPSGSGKSFFTADIAQHIATGQSWRGRKVEQKLVVYIASEAGSSILKRFVAWRDNRMGEAVERIPLAVMTRGPNLLADVQVENLISDLRKLALESQLALGLVIFDTLSRSIPGGDENTAEDMTMVIKAADSIRDDLGASTAYVHHSGKDASKGARGHSALFAAADLVLRIEDHSATVEKVRDGVSGERFPFRLDPIELGTDADGDAVYTCLLSAADQGVYQPKPKGAPIGKNQKIVFKEIASMSSSIDSSPGTSEIPKGVKIIRFEDLLEKSATRFAGIEPFRIKARVAEAVAALQASGHVGVHGDLLWPVDKSSEL